MTETLSLPLTLDLNPYPPTVSLSTHQPNLTLNPYQWPRTDHSHSALRWLWQRAEAAASETQQVCLYASPGVKSSLSQELRRHMCGSKPATQLIIIPICLVRRQQRTGGRTLRALT